MCIILLINLLIEHETVSLVQECGLIVIVDALLNFALQIELALLKRANVELADLWAFILAQSYRHLLPLNPALMTREVDDAECYKKGEERNGDDTEYHQRLEGLTA